MEWNKFNESPREYPERVFENSIAGFEKATNGLAQMSCTALNAVGKMSSHLHNEFQFIVYLGSQYVPSYKLKVMTFGYNIELAPIVVDLEDSIYEEVTQKRKGYQEKLRANNEQEFKELLEKVFKSQRFIEVVTGLMKIASKGKK